MKSRSLPPWPGNKQGSHSVVNVSIFAPRSNFAYIFNASRSENCKTKTTLWVQNVLNLPALKFKNSMINRYFKIPQITCFGGIVHLLEDRIEKLTCVCRSNFEGRIVFQHWKFKHACVHSLFHQDLIKTD